ncbi:MAG: hypothetical protein CM1200mP10_02050 [Candidatus Neomarinimicrobiota bacterium]|nr:MAG: hypothetical protein CM1200mP10_02050 [Candidatus Neomarinimicrobiota bacterium]
MVSTKIPEFDDPYEISEYSKRLNSTVHLILTAYDDHNPIAFKIGYHRILMDHFTVGWGESYQIIVEKVLLITWLITRRPGQRKKVLNLLSFKPDQNTMQC